MRKLTGFVIALLLGIAGAVVFDGRTARADHSYVHDFLLRSAEPRVMHLRALLALNNGNRVDYTFYKSRLETLGTYTYGSMDPFNRGSSTKADAARWLLNDLPAFDRANAPDHTHEGGGGEAE
jgi:hypothetical protein